MRKAPIAPPASADQSGRGTWSLRFLLVISLLLFSLMPAAVVGGLMYRSNVQSVDELSEKIMRDVALRVQGETENHLEQVNSLLNALLPAQFNPAQLSSAAQLLTQPQAFEQLAFRLTRMSANVSFLYYGNAHGTFLGVQKELDDPLQRSKIHERTTGAGRNYFLATQPGDRSTPLPPETKTYEPRQRPWYLAAVEKKNRVFSSVYPSASSGQLLITLAQPVVQPDGSVPGVFAVDLFLKRLDDLLKAQTISQQGAAMLLDEEGYLLATSVAEPLFSAQGDGWKRHRTSDVRDPALAAAHKAIVHVMGQPDNLAAQRTVMQRRVALPNGETQLIVMRPFGENLGLKWTLIVAAPESDFSAERQRAITRSVYAMLAVLLLGALVAAAFALHLSAQFGQLRQAALQIGRGQMPQTPSRSHITEVRVLSAALDASAQEILQNRAAIQAQTQELNDANANLEVRVAQRTAELQASREEALAAARAKATFLATMSHEIRTPLSGVVGMTTLLADTPLNAEQSDYLHTMRVSSDQLLGVVDDILDFSKIESGKLDLENERLSVRATVEEAIEIAAARAREKGLDLLVDIQDNVPRWVSGDVTRLRQVLLNYLNNAIKFTEQGQVVVSVELQRELPGDAVVLGFRVDDTGIGIPLDRQEALFESFSQVDASTTRRYGGTGLGLAICKRLAQLMGGAVGMESVPAVGSRFWFTARLELATAPEPSPSSVFGKANLVGKTALVLDDTALHLRILDKQLKRWGMTVALFGDAKHALAWLATHPVDMVITDMHMPDMDGLAFGNAVRALYPQVHLLLVTSGNMPSGKAAAVFDARLLKPYRQAQLFDALTQAEKAPAAPAVSLLPVAKNQRVLVADDNLVNLKVANFMLTKLGYNIDTAMNGREAVDKVAQALLPGATPYAAVLMDVNMPVLDGIRASLQIAQAHGPLAPPVWALTASVLAEDRQRYREAGMLGPLAKPLHIDELAQALANPIVTTPSSTDSLLPNPTFANLTRTLEPTHTDKAPMVDWDRLAQFAEFDDDGGTLVRNVVGLFVDELPARLAALRAAVDAHDVQALSLAAHALKGAASNVGASAIAQACFVLEQACKNEQWPSEAHQQVRGIEALGPNTHRAFTHWLKDASAPPITPTSP